MRLGNTLTKWIGQFLLGRQIRIHVNGSFSSWIDVISGVPRGSVLKPTEQCIQAARKAQSVLAMIKRQFKISDKEDFGKIYKTYVRPHLEYCIQAWSPKLQKDKILLEKV